MIGLCRAGTQPERRHFYTERDGVLEHRGSGGIGRHSGLKKGRLQGNL